VIDLLNFIESFIKKRENILIIGNYSGENIGDNAILKVMLHDINNESKINKVFIPTRFVDKIKKIWENELNINVVGVQIKNTIQVFLSGIKSKIIIIGGGTIFSKYSGPFVFFIAPFIFLMKIFGKKIVFYSIGYEKSSSKLIDIPIKFCFLLSNKISVRDKQSLKNLEFIQKIKKIELIEDPVKRIENYSNNLAIRKKVELKIQDIEHSYGNLSNFIFTSFNFVKEKYINKKLIVRLSEIIQKLSQNEKVVLSTFYHPNDLKLNKKIISKIENKQNIFVLEEILDPFVIIEIMKKAKFIIAERLHSMVLANISKKPFFAISYQEKCDAFLDQIKHKEKISLEEFLNKKIKVLNYEV